MSDEEFLKLVDAGIDALRPDVKERMKNVAIVIADEPSLLQREENGLGEEDTLFGLYEGIPQTERGVTDDVVLPDKITIFKLPILKTYSDPEDIATCVENTVWHEVAHHFGMEEDEVEEEERRRGKLL
jgi:predicted Zn-dependent protease with MMP-like domain